MTGHLTDDQLHDLCDDRLPESLAAAIRAHASACAPCGERLRRLEALFATAAQAPRRIAPPEDLWPGIRERITTGPESVVAPADRRVPWWTRPGPALAAAAMLVIVSAAVTAWLLAPDPTPPAPRFVGTTPALSADTPADVGLLITNYEGLAQRLAVEFERVRHRLPPEAGKAVEANLAVIDSALVEIRGVLEDEPANAALLELLASTYRQKVSVLEHATESIS